MRGRAKEHGHRLSQSWWDIRGVEGWVRAAEVSLLVGVVEASGFFQNILNLFLACSSNEAMLKTSF